MIPKQAQEKLNALARSYGPRLLADVTKALAKYGRTGELEQSATLIITEATDKQAPRIVVQYADQGYFIGQTNPQWTKMPPVNDIAAWSQHVNFKGTVPGYKYDPVNLPPWKIKQRIAWAIAISKKKWDTHKPKRWKRQAKLSEILSEMNEETLAVYKSAVQKILTDTLEGR